MELDLEFMDLEFVQVDLDLEVGLEGFIDSLSHWSSIRIWLLLSWVMSNRPKPQQRIVQLRFECCT